MRWVAALAVSAFMAIAFVVAVVSLVVWQLSRLNRVSPDYASPAPLSWLAAPSAPARLHRRLRNTVLVARGAAAEYPSATDLVRQIEAHAIALDRHACVAARLRSTRSTTLRDLFAQVDQLEALTGRLASVAIDAARLPALPGESARPPCPDRRSPRRPAGRAGRARAVDRQLAPRGVAEPAAIHRSCRVSPL